jgi:hypothetical protein
VRAAFPTPALSWQSRAVEKGVCEKSGSAKCQFRFSASLFFENKGLEDKLKAGLVSVLSISFAPAQMPQAAA